MTTPNPEHATTCTDEMVRGYWGTVARCICGWSDSWSITDGSAEACAERHMRTRVPGYAEEQDERSRIWWAEQEIRNAESKAKLDAYKARTTGHSQAVTSKPCHDCSCHVHPPCSACESCVHIDYPECPNDCQDCEEPHEY